MLILQIYLFLGLVFHKLVWEVLKSSSAEKPIESRSPKLLAIKAVKVAILVGIMVQVFLPDIFPISTEPIPVRLVGIAIYTLGLATAVAARFQLGGNWANIETGQILGSQRLVASGIYSYVRHPIYVGDLLLLAGIELALNSWLVLSVLILAPAVMLKAAKEERMLAGGLAGYDVYRRHSKRFIPFVF